MSLGFGTAARIGHLYPSGGLCDYEIQLMAPAGVQFLTTRLPFARTGLEADHEILANLETHARLLADAEVSLIAMNCTAAGMVAGPEAVNRRIRDATGIAAVTTIEAVQAALAAVGSRRVALLTPYPDEVVAAETAYLAAAGIEVAVAAGPACGTPVEQALLSPRSWVELARAAAGSGADTLLFSCAGIQIAAVLEEIEQRTGLPVVTSNQALLWWVLRTIGHPDRPAGYGRLLAGEWDGAALSRPAAADR